MPFWGSAGSGNDQDTYELDFGRPTTFNEVDLYFFNDREVLGVPDQHRVTTSTNRYREPSLYTIQVFREDEGWVDVNHQVKTPTNPRSNFNRVEFNPTTAERMRVLMTHREGFGTGLKEILVFRNGGPPVPQPVNQAPQVIVREDPSFQQPGQVRLEGIVKDDGLPSGTLETEWTAVSGPGLALIDDPSAHSTVVSFSEEGEYVLELSASDEELTTTGQVVVAITDLSGGVNVALRATPACTNTSPWESCDAINDGADPTGPPQYGTWPTTGDQALEYEWDEPVRVDSAAMWFFQDVPPGADGGVQAPGAWNIQWWDGEEFVDVENPEGFGTELDQFNEATFDPVTTTRLRANLMARDGQADAEGIGVREWQVFAEAPDSLREVHVRTNPGELPTLPETVEAVFADGTRLDRAVQWQAISEDELEDNVDITVLGVVADTNVLAEATVWVRPLDLEVDIRSVQDEEVVTLPAVAPALPQTVIVTFNDGSRDSSFAVAWEEIDPADYAEPGNVFTVAGAVEGTDTSAQATVTVLGDP